MNNENTSGEFTFREKNQVFDAAFLLEQVTPTPTLGNGFSSEEKKAEIKKSFAHIMQVLGLDLSDDSLRETPDRVAKMMVDEVFVGLMPEAFPKITLVENKFHYEQSLIEININVQSFCEHHFVPIMGKCHIAYRPQELIIGLSKLNRVVDYFCRRPQVQERLTIQIYQALSMILGTADVFVAIDALHSCVKARGIKDASSITRTYHAGGRYMTDAFIRQEVMLAIPKTSDLVI